ncbi:Hsp20/alpha crystallin family protein [Abyssisolibacter fermentans]|uniref:Hsp20/alpha crystallin family protein n=1 Tax=Abyssisolibacter fermentans TaxID=1766203 RepID=UPI00082A1C29|nr:Hsp20/alpha crystallin family protein [Abyssisolibacter fermentans]
MGKLIPYNKQRDNSMKEHMDKYFFEQPDIIINKLFNNFFNNKFIDNINTNIEETKENYIIELKLHGFKKEQIDIQINSGYLVVKGQKRDDLNVEKNGYTTRKSRIGHFKRSFKLEDIDNRRINAFFENGVLKITMPKIKS